MLTGNHLHHTGVEVKQCRVRVFTRQQIEQQLIKVVARHQGITRGHDMAALPFGRLEGFDFGVTPKGQMLSLIHI